MSIENSESVHIRGGAAEPGPLQLEDIQACGDKSADVQWIPIEELVLTKSPRTAGENNEHTRALAESEDELPPIIVQRGTNRVVDGMYRVRAAQLRGEHAIRARFFDGDDENAFVLAVRLNVKHGLPLTLAERKEAAGHILHAHPTWSNRAIAKVAGLSHKTIAGLREKSNLPEIQARVGRDGRERPLSTTSGRERAKSILENSPTSSLREVSAVAGVSPGTVRAVREQLRQDSREIPNPRSAAPASSTKMPHRKVAARRRDRPADPEAVLRALRADPLLRFTESGRLLLSILAVASMDADAYERLIVDLPEHCVDPVAELAAASVDAWQELTFRLDQRRSSSSGPD
ncbi:ParB-like nuclease domain-containing protein [Actinopolyspora alba]|uniref:ParB-like nuclease domain-containing protein n=1 Tax=Actinopolyspora alba TaxID=673379 RepID=A0A1I1YUY9_9ACTN|nr:ParB/RepB/Spo0J family partition protein [Actinopolyspora alba]SFE23424.1 ParB-like nuclease domain-containing protein [Actinopolyspora alba]